jgi:hypothetical protein
LIEIGVLKQMQLNQKLALLKQPILMVEFGDVLSGDLELMIYPEIYLTDIVLIDLL